MPEISVVIPIYNGKKFIKPSLDSLFNQSFRNFEAIVIDNGSQDDTENFIKINYPQVIFIKNKNNFGVSKARNQGISIASGDWVLSLDCDVILQNGFLSQIHQAIQTLPPGIGMIQPKILKTNPGIIYSCGVALSFLRRFYDIGKGSSDGQKFNEPKYVFGSCSAAAVYKRDMLEEIKENTGYFDERFFFLVEDVDLAWRAQNRGWKALFYPAALCKHSGNSSAFGKKVRQYLCLRNRYYSIIKNEGWMRYSAKIIPLLFYDLPRLLYLLFTNPYIYKSPEF